jgi:serine protease Do
MRRWWIVSLLVAISLVVVACGQGADQGEQGNGEDQGEDTSNAVSTLEEVRDATVYIEARGGSYDVGREFGEQSYGSGSGFIVSPEGIAVTNNHVVTGAGFLQVYVEGEDKPKNAKILGSSECSDLALIDIDGGGYPYMEWYDGEINSGLTVTAAGYPADDVEAGVKPDYTVTRGIVNTTEADGNTQWASVGSVLEHDALIRGGSSGGPLVDENGQAVGINFAGATDESGSSTGQQFAIARDEAQSLIDQLREGDVTSIGISGEAYSDPENEFSGILVAGVETGSPASNAGIQGGQEDSFDVITEIEGTRLAEDGTMETYCNILRGRDADQPLRIQVYRAGLDENGNLTSLSVLEGELNGKELEEVETLLDGGDSGGSGDVTSYSDYTEITDETGTLSMEVPVEWADQRLSGSFEFEGEDVGPSMGAAFDYDAWINSFSESGAYMAASSSLAQQFGEGVEDAVLDANDFSGTCEYDGRFEDYDDGVYTGKYDIWTNCEGTGSEFHVLAAVPEDRSFVILVQVAVVNEADAEAEERILETFTVNQAP